MLTSALLLCASSALALPTILTNDTFGGPHIPGQIPTNPKEPLQQRTAYVNSTAMHVSWNTYAQLDDGEAVVEYGITPLDLNETGMAQSSTYPTARTWSHHALLTNLQPSTTYWYRVANTNCLGCSEIPTYRFTTARVPGDMSPYTLAMVADLGTMGHDGLTTYGGPDLASGNHTLLRDGQSNTIQSLLQELDTYDAVVHAGDLVYADYFREASSDDPLQIKASVAGFWGNGSVIVNQTSVETAYQTITEEFYDQMQPITAMRPYMVAPGNHDSNCGTSDKKNNITYDVTICVEGQTNFTGYRNHWKMPGFVTDGEENFWYSYDDGMVHYVFFNTETDFGNNVTAPDEPTAKSLGLDSGPFGTANEQLNWLKNDLSSVDRSKTPWVVAVGHRPWYVAKNDTLCPTCQTTFEPYFIQYNVDLVLQGHVHVYSRSLPVANNTVDPNGMNDPKAPIYIVNGAGGHYDGLDNLDPPTNYTGFQEDSAYGWSKFIFHNRTHVTTQFIASENGTVLDEATLYKSHA